MGYESKIYVVRQYKVDDTVVYNSILTMLDMSKMGCDFDYHKAFPDELEGTLYIGQEYNELIDDYVTVDTNKDCYGVMHCGTIDTALNELKKHLGDNYYMFDVLYATLSAFKLPGFDDLIVVQYGY